MDEINVVNENEIKYNKRKFLYNKNASKYIRKDNTQRRIFYCKNYRKNEKFRENLNLDKFCKMKIIQIINKNGKTKYEFIGNHSEECNNIYNRNENENIQIYDYERYKVLCEAEFNLEPEYKRKNFINICQRIYNGNVWKFKYSESRISNFIKEWKLKSNKFTKYYFLEKILNKRGIQYLKEYKYHEVYNYNTNRIDINEFFIWGSDFQIIRLRNSDFLKIDATFHFPKKFTQTLIIMYYESLIDRYIPTFYVAMNSKTECISEEVISSISNLINRGYSEAKIFKTITTDNEQALVNAINKYFPNTSRISC